MTTLTTSLKSRWDTLLAEKPKLRIRNAAQELGVSELELLTCGQPSDEVIRLDYDLQPMMKDMEALGDLMALTRNEHVVHERKGTYSNFSQPSPHVALFVNPEIDLRVFPGPWKHAYAVLVPSRGKVRRSIQFFSKWGEAVHKVYLQDQDKVEAYDAFVAKYRSADQIPVTQVEPEPKPKMRAVEGIVDVKGFQQSWVNLQDTHDFFPLMAKHRLTRLQALELAPKPAADSFFPHHAVQVNASVVRSMFEAVRDTDTHIMVFVGNAGMIQIHTGEIRNLVDYGSWFNVMDKRFNLHLDMDALAQCWLVFKPTKDGVVSSLEVFDHDENMLVQVFGKRKPGIAELPEWREIVTQHLPA